MNKDSGLQEFWSKFLGLVHKIGRGENFTETEKLKFTSAHYPENYVGFQISHLYDIKFRRYAITYNLNKGTCLCGNLIDHRLVLIY